jgi:3',5'-cyclic-nucleotide phosphodiesterase
MQVRKLVIDMILATDMSKHFDLLSFMRTKYDENSDFTNKDIRADLFRLCIKSADVGHAAKHIELHEKWCFLVIEEFFAQGDEEKKRGLPVSMYCDRETTNIAKSQAGFIKTIVLTLFTTLNSILASDEIESACVNQLRQNEAYWHSLGKQRNFSSVHKMKDAKHRESILTVFRRKSLRKGSLQPESKSPGKY